MAEGSSSATVESLLRTAPRWHWKTCVIWSLVLTTFMGVGLYSGLQLNEPGDPEISPPLFLAMMQFEIVAGYGIYYSVRRTRHLERLQQMVHPDGALDVFISHCAADIDLARALVRVLEGAFTGIKVRCTSVDGHRLEVGEDIDDKLRAEVLECRSFIGLITPASMRSEWVLFECGARWGLGLHLFPLLARGADSKGLRGPMQHLNVADAQAPAQVYAVVDSVGRQTGITRNDTARFSGLVDEVVALARPTVAAAAN